MVSDEWTRPACFDWRKKIILSAGEWSQGELAFPFREDLIDVRDTERRVLWNVYSFQLHMAQAISVTKNADVCPEIHLSPWLLMRSGEGRS